MNLKRILIVPLLLILAGAGLAACGSDSGDSLKVSDAWARSTPPGQETSAIYLKIEGGPEADSLVAASVPTDIAGKTEIHETVESGGAMADGQEGHQKAGESDGQMNGDTKSGDHMQEGDANAQHGMTGASGTMAMHPVDAVEVPAGKTVMLEPGGFHVMLFDLPKALKAGDTIPVTLTFEKAGEIKVDAEVRDV